MTSRTRCRLACGWRRVRGRSGTSADCCRLDGEVEYDLDDDGVIDLHKQRTFDALGRVVRVETVGKVDYPLATDVPWDREGGSIASSTLYTLETFDGYEGDEQDHRMHKLTTPTLVTVFTDYGLDGTTETEARYGYDDLGRLVRIRYDDTLGSVFNAEYRWT